jgi:hypothetical protein
MQLGFGMSRAVPEDVTTAWGARLIAPCDLLHDRQDLVAENDEAKQELISWLNGEPSGTGAIAKAREWLRENYRGMRQDWDDEHILYEDTDGKIVGSTNASYGYVYVAGWLKPDRHEVRETLANLGRQAEAAAEERQALRDIRRSTQPGRLHDALTVDRYEAVRAAIPAERWHTKYGWSEHEAAKMDGTGDEVRLYAVYGDGTRREIQPNKRSGEFEFGYHGSGPHATAEAIVNDRLGVENDSADDDTYVPPARAFDFVPEVQERVERGDDNRARHETLTVLAADVDARIEAAREKVEG